jgi:hypothetical protein
MRRQNGFVSSSSTPHPLSKLTQTSKARIASILFLSIFFAPFSLNTVHSNQSTLSNRLHLYYNMRPTTSLLAVFLSFTLATADLIPAPHARAPETRPQARSVNRSLGKRQFCPADNDFCLADNGDAVCQSADEVCCQLMRGTDPYTCPLSHPYCCGADQTTGILLCGSDDSCGTQDFFTAPPVVAPTETTGIAGPTKTARPASKQTNNTDDDEDEPKQKGSAASQRGGLAAAVLAAGVAVML